MSMPMPGKPLPIPRKRVVSYIDGFNLYHGLRDSDWRRYLWLDLRTLSKSLILDTQELTLVKYFTSRISGPEDKKRRQDIYLEALEAHCKDLKMYFGYYQVDPWECGACGMTHQIPSEKKTDVNIAVEIMTDAYSNSFDTALIMTADSDLVPPILAVKRLFPQKRLVVAFPPNRHSVVLKQEAHSSFPIGRAKFAQSQLPDTVHKKDGTKLSRPDKWKAAQTEFGKALESALKTDIQVSPSL